MIPEKFQTLKGCCASMCFPVLQPDSRFRSGWNVALACFILYCGIAVPLEIAFESDMVLPLSFPTLASQLNPPQAPAQPPPTPAHPSASG